MTRPRVLLLAPGPESRGGMDTVVRTILDSPLRDQLDMQRLTTHRPGGPVAKLLAGLGGYLRLVGEIVTHRPDLVWIHATSGFSIRRKAAAAGLLRALSVPYIFHLHSAKVGRHLAHANKWERAILGNVLRRAESVIVLDPSWEEWLAELDVTESIFIPNPVAVPNEIPDPASRPQLVVQIGNVSRPKGAPETAAGFLAIADEFPQARLILAGELLEPEVSAVIVDDPHRDQVELPGWVEPNAVADLLDEAAILVLASHVEGMPMVVLEAMTHGATVVCTPVGALPSVIQDGHNGILVPVGDSAAIARALRTLLNHRDRAAQLAARARQTVQDAYSLQAVLPKYRAVIHGAIDRYRSSTRRRRRVRH